MRIALLEPFAGVAGDMFVGACLDAGASFPGLKRTLEGLGLEGVRVTQRKVSRCGVAARKFRVRAPEERRHRGLAAIRKILKRAELDRAVRARAEAAFTRLGEAEAKVHGIALAEVHFHEVGAADAICDIVGAALCLASLEVERVYCRPLPLSTGWVEAAHGRIPVPAPATLELMKGRPSYDSGLEGELVTPTGAALVAAWAERAPPPPFTVTAIGYGAGDRDPAEYPNVCRITVGEADGAAPAGLWELVCDLDDATPQVLGGLIGRLLEAGALDATLAPVQMKKERPGTRVCALVRAASIPAVEEVLFAEGTTLGVRRRAVERTELPRRVVRVQTPHGSVRLKIGELGGRVVHVAPEYEDCAALARQAGVPLREVMRLAMAQWRG